LAIDVDSALSDLKLRLYAEREEIEEALLVRVYGIEEPSETEFGYRNGLHAAVSAALDYAISAINEGDGFPPIPLALLTQSRLAARTGVSLETVVRRYLSGFMLLSTFVAKAAEAEGLSHTHILHSVVQAQALQVDRIIESIAAEYRREAAESSYSSQHRRLERVRRLLNGEPIDLEEFGYNFDGWHLGLVIHAAPEGCLRELAAALGRRLFWVESHDSLAWAWLWGSRPINSTEVVAEARRLIPAATRLAVGEPARGCTGWRLTHKQARAAFQVAGEGGAAVVRYAEVGLVSCVLGDEVMSASLRQRYLLPLSTGRNGGVLRETLRAYFASGRNISSAAAALRVNRQTVRSRLRMIEEQIGSSLDDCGAEVEIALRVEQYQGSSMAEPGRDLSPNPERDRAAVAGPG
jgi:PucR C-terminal helix-turn-helix domain/GGDEF-like domain